MKHLNLLVIVVLALAPNVLRAQGGLELPYINTSLNLDTQVFNITNSGSGNVVRSATTGLGTAGQFVIYNPSNSSNALYSTTNGSGSSIYGTNSGTGTAGFFQVLNSQSNGHAITASTVGTGMAIYANQTGSARAVGIIIGNPNNSSEALLATTQGTGWSSIFTAEAGKGVLIQAAPANLGLHVKQGKIQFGAAPVPEGYQLSVDGKAVVEELKVELSQDWADYVFADDYDLDSLDEVEQFIKSNGHLPGIPSADEVANEGGVLIGSMQVKLLQKIEELTLYMIDLNKENAMLKGRLETMENLMESN